jgi:hypothetical protein
MAASARELELADDPIPAVQRDSQQDLVTKCAELCLIDSRHRFRCHELRIVERRPAMRDEFLEGEHCVSHLWRNREIVQLPRSEVPPAAWRTGHRFGGLGTDETSEECHLRVLHDRHAALLF